jgi:hypothetical protein
LSLQTKSLQTRRALEKARFGLAGESWDTGRDFVKSRFYKSYYESGWHGLKAFIRRHGVDFRNEFGETPLMIAAREGLLDLTKLLLDGGADPQQKNFFGLMPIQMLMLEIFSGRRYDEGILNELFQLLAPEVLSYRSGNRLVKVDRRLIEYLLLLAAAPFTILKSQQSFYVMQVCYTTTSLETMLGLLPTNIFPEKRRKKTYLSAALSRNEVLREGPYNRKLFVRLKTGHYVIFPRLFWENHEGWTDFYSSLNWESLKVMADRDFVWSLDKAMSDINRHFNETERSIELSASSPNQ